jgi:hypothetical protein
MTFLWQNEDKAGEELDNVIIPMDYATKMPGSMLLFNDSAGAGQSMQIKAQLPTISFLCLKPDSSLAS